MGIVLRATTVAMVLGTVLGGCAEKRATPASAAAKAPVTAPAPAYTEAVPAPKHPRLGEAGVYVDGRQVGVMRGVEMPPSMKPRHVIINGGYDVTRYPFTDYARSLGIDPAKVKSLHLYGGSRVVPVDGAEFRRLGDGLLFAFSQGERGKPRVYWPPVKLNVVTTIDLLSNVVFYVDKEPPHLENGELVMPNGDKVGDAIPYAGTEPHGGTRVYVDGELVGSLKRKRLTDDLIVSTGDEPRRFGIEAFATKLGGNVAKATAMDLLAGDDVIAHVSGDDAKEASFRVPSHNQGKMLVDLHDGAAKVSAVQFYVKTKPPARPVRSLDEVPAAQPDAPGPQDAPADDDEH